MKIFDFFKKKVTKITEESAESFEARKAKYQARKVYLDKEYKKIIDKIYEEDAENTKKWNDEAKKTNSICPHCGSNDIIQIYHRPKGEIRGSGSYSSGLFGGYGSGNVNGRLDSLRVNKCKNCGQEWEFEEESRSSFSQLENALRSLFLNVDGITRISFNPKDITEEFNSLEEKRQHEIEKIKDSVSFEIIPVENITIETLAFYFCKRNYHLYNSIEDLGEKVENEYLYEFNKDVIKVFEDLGFKHIEI